MHEPNGVGLRDGDKAYTLEARTTSQAAILEKVVRRMTPLEHERLMGIPDHYTLIPYPKSIPAKDGPRYRAIGNSMAVPVLSWIGRRLQTVDEMLEYLPVD